MRKNMKHNFRVNATLIVTAVILFALLGIYVYLDHESNYLVGSQFSLNEYKHSKYRIALEENYSYKSGTVIPVSNYREYKKVAKHYKFDKQSNLAKEDFKDTNYLYVIVGETGCFDYTNYEYYTINDNRVDIYFGEGNCVCQINRGDTYVYELIFSEEITEDMTFNVNYLTPGSNAREMCDLSK